jgi:hypothetical protein
LLSGGRFGAASIFRGAQNAAALIMAYQDDDDLFGEEFDFVDEDDDGEGEDSSVEEEAKPRKRPPAREKTPAKPPAKRGSKPAAAGKREPRREAPAEASPPRGAERDEAPVDGPPADAEAEAEAAPAQPAGPPADHVVHIYEYGKFKRTIDRKFTDEEAVSFAEEFTRTGKPYGRYAIATPDDEEPADTFAEAAKG